MVAIPTKDWIDFVTEVRARLDVIDTNIANTRELSDVQHKQLRDDFLEFKQQLMEQDPGSLANRVRSLEDSRTKMNGVQLGLSFAFSAFASALAWLIGHPNVHLTMNDAWVKITAFGEAILGFFGRKH